MQENDIIATLETADQAPDSPLILFRQWFALAEGSEPVDPNAMALATVDQSGKSSVRMVLMKAFDERGFVFFTNMQSRKGESLIANPNAALCFHWKSLARSIRIEGTFSPVSKDESDAYYNTRARGSRLSAWASQQSRPLASRTTLTDAVDAMDRKYEGTDNIPRPAHWAGCRIAPERIEFWHDGKFRVHTRLLYTKQGSTWGKQLLFP